MRKALVSLFGAGLIASLIMSSCVVKKTDDDNGDGSSSQGGGINVGRGGAATGLVGNETGGTSGITLTPGAEGGSDNGPAECEGLLEKFQFKNTNEVCSISKRAAKFTKINIMIVVDKSGSMSTVPAGYVKSKWQGAIDALKTSLNPADNLTSYGLILYPYLNETTKVQACELNTGEAAVNVSVGPAPQTVPLINAMMAASGSAPSGGTPTAGALDAALQYYTTGGGLALEGQKYVLLVTDGGPNCNDKVAQCGAERCTMDLDKTNSCGTTVFNCCDPKNGTPGGPNPTALCLDDQNVLNKLALLRNSGISTFVIGIPGSEVYAQYLDQFADAGGTAIAGKTRKYYEVTNETGLAEAFKSITTSLVRGCTVQLQETPPDPGKINVAVDCIPIGAKSGPDGTVNWQYDPATNSVIFQGSQCARIEQTGVQRIDIVNGCTTITFI